MLKTLDARVYLGLRNSISVLAKPFNNKKGDDGNEQGMVRKSIGLIGLTLIIILIAGMLAFATGKANTMFAKVKAQFQTIEGLLP